ncbi:alanyl-tRNA editing protein [bacterium (candidate division B38) B3_B38]|nr:MAG: alanyl-tRNA editing protein [bacterium (candidate division B38) B3_B38]
MTEKLYLKNPYLATFSARVLAQNKTEQGHEVLLDQTAFYPTSGGQPHDQGTLNGIAVRDVLLKDDEIFHLLEQPLSVSKVKGEIDWMLRSDHMQQHTGQHLLTAVFIELCQASTVSFHLGRELSTIDLDIGLLTELQVEQVEELANQYIIKNLPIKAYEVSPEEFSRLKLRKKELPEGVKSIRIVEIEGVDLSHCGGTHLRSTSEIGLIKVIGWEKYKGNMRVSFLCGRRALKDYRQKHKVMQGVSASLSVKPEKLSEAVDKLREEGKGYRRELKHLKERLAGFIAQELIDGAAPHEGFKLVKMIFRQEDLQVVKSAIIKAVNQEPLLVLAGVESQGMGHLIFASSKGLGLPLGEALRESCKVIDGKGGGGEGFAQGAGTNPQHLEKALELALDYLKLKG